MQRPRVPRLRSATEHLSDDLMEQRADALEAAPTRRSPGTDHGQTATEACRSRRAPAHTWPPRDRSRRGCDRPAGRSRVCNQCQVALSNRSRPRWSGAHGQASGRRARRSVTMSRTVSGTASGSCPAERTTRTKNGLPEGSPLQLSGSSVASRVRPDRLSTRSAMQSDSSPLQGDGRLTSTLQTCCPRSVQGRGRGRSRASCRSTIIHDHGSPNLHGQELDELEGGDVGPLRVVDHDDERVNSPQATARSCPTASNSRKHHASADSSDVVERGGAEGVRRSLRPSARLRRICCSPRAITTSAGSIDMTASQYLTHGRRGRGTLAFPTCRPHRRRAPWRSSRRPIFHSQALSCRCLARPSARRAGRAR